MHRHLVTFGTGDCGRLGHGIPLVSLFFPRILRGPWGESDPPRQVAAGAAHTLLCTEEGAVYSFGLNDKGQLGHNPRLTEVPHPDEVLLPDTVSAVAAGSRHSLALTKSGEVWAWGDASQGALGLGGDLSIPLSKPRLIKFLQGQQIVSIAAGLHHSLAVSSGGEVFSWGRDSQGCLGLGSALIGEVEPRPRVLRALETHRIASVSAGHTHSACIGAQGEAFVWGDPDFVPGVRRVHESKVSKPRLIPLKWAAGIACGGEMTLAIGANGQLFEWGLGRPGLGPGSGELSAPIPNIAAVKIAAGWQHCAAINTQGHLLTWGWGGSQGTAWSWQSAEASDGGQLGHGPNCQDRGEPWPVEYLDDDGRMIAQHLWKAQDVSCGFNHTAAVVEIQNSA